MTKQFKIIATLISLFFGILIVMQLLHVDVNSNKDVSVLQTVSYSETRVVSQESVKNVNCYMSENKVATCNTVK